MFFRNIFDNALNIKKLLSQNSDSNEFYRRTVYQTVILLFDLELQRDI